MKKTPEFKQIKLTKHSIFQISTSTGGDNGSIIRSSKKKIHLTSPSPPKQQKKMPTFRISIQIKRLNFSAFNGVKEECLSKRYNVTQLKGLHLSYFTSLFYATEALFAFKCHVTKIHVDDV